MSAPRELWVHTQDLHRRRTEPRVAVDPDIAGDPVLAAAWRECQMHWLATVPGYREEIKQRVAVAARRADKIARKFERQYENVDYLEREVEGCG